MAVKETLESYIRSRASAQGLSLGEVCRRAHIGPIPLHKTQAIPGLPHKTLTSGEVGETPAPSHAVVFDDDSVSVRRKSALPNYPLR